VRSDKNQNMNALRGIIALTIVGVIGITSTYADFGTCDCQLVDGGGCIISPLEPPPPGFKCQCTKFRIHGGTAKCDGVAVKCESPNDDGCSGCTEKECCLGEECDGYNVKKKRETPEENRHCIMKGFDCWRRPNVCCSYYEFQEHACTENTNWRCA